tara:strand:- start:424 stop:657 length:234 start_codon:yes stop_codon:yes gene_type:complete
MDTRPIYDITGPDGNAFAIMGFVRQTLRDIGEDSDYIEGVLSDMKSGNYENLLEIAVIELGDFVYFEGLERYGIDNF